MNARKRDFLLSLAASLTAAAAFAAAAGRPIDFDILSSMMRLTTSLALPPANGMR